MRQPMRASRVVEAAVRSFNRSLINNSNDLAHLLTSVFWAAETISPEGAALSTDLLGNKRLTIRSCSQIISALKLVSQPLGPGISREKVVQLQLQLASYAAMAGPTVHSWAMGE